jgi:hypothetical protein
MAAIPTTASGGMPILVLQEGSSQTKGFKVRILKLTDTHTHGAVEKNQTGNQGFPLISMIQ